MMTTTRLRKIMQLLHWSQRDVAAALQCSDRLVRMWANGEAPVPAEVGAWLEALVAAHEACTPPTGFRIVSGRPSTRHWHPRSAAARS